MDFFPSRSLIFEALDRHALDIEAMLKADVIYYYGAIDLRFKMLFIDEIESLASKNKSKKLAFFITTNGGSAEMVEIMVEIMRNFYHEVYFFVPDYAFSAGTILCMSGDKIYMNYYSSLGPIDPQVIVNGKFVSAQGYIDQLNTIVQKSKDGTVTPVEMQMALNINLADINFYEQSINLTINLLKKWLVLYKFKDWTIHSHNNIQVTEEEKVSRATEIATKLGNNSIWNSHGRHIGIDTLRNDLKLKIESIDANHDLSELTRGYHHLVNEFVMQLQTNIFIHSRESRR